MVFKISSGGKDIFRMLKSGYAGYVIRPCTNLLNGIQANSGVQANGYHKNGTASAREFKRHLNALSRNLLKTVRCSEEKGRIKCIFQKGTPPYSGARTTIKRIYASNISDNNYLSPEEQGRKLKRRKNSVVPPLMEDTPFNNRTEYEENNIESCWNLSPEDLKLFETAQDVRKKDTYNEAVNLTVYTFDNAGCSSKDLTVARPATDIRQGIDEAAIEAEIIVEPKKIHTFKFPESIDVKTPKSNKGKKVTFRNASDNCTADNANALETSNDFGHINIGKLKAAHMVPSSLKKSREKEEMKEYDKNVVLRNRRLRRERNLTKESVANLYDRELKEYNIFYKKMLNHAKKELAGLNALKKKNVNMSFSVDDLVVTKGTMKSHPGYAAKSQNKLPLQLSIEDLTPPNIKASLLEADVKSDSPSSSNADTYSIHADDIEKIKKIFRYLENRIHSLEDKVNNKLTEKIAMQVQEVKTDDVFIKQLLKQSDTFHKKLCTDREEIETMKVKLRNLELSSLTTNINKLFSKLFSRHNPKVRAILKEGSGFFTDVDLKRKISNKNKPETAKDNSSLTSDHSRTYLPPHLRDECNDQIVEVKQKLKKIVNSAEQIPLAKTYPNSTLSDRYDPSVFKFFRHFKSK